MKGKIKKLVALALATIMVLAMGITAFAVESDPVADVPPTGTINVKGANVGTYYAYKIFDGTADGNNMSYTASGNVLAELKRQATDNIIKDENGVTLFTLVESDNGTTYVTIGDADKAAVWIQNHVNELIGENPTPSATYEVEEGSKTAVLANLAYGYYYVRTETEVNGTAVMLTSVNGTVDINEKHGVPGFGEDPDDGKHVDGKKTYEIGETIKYRIQYSNALNYVNGKLITTYTVNDDLATGIELVPDTLHVYVDNATSDENPTGEVSMALVPSLEGIHGSLTWVKEVKDEDGTTHLEPIYADAPSVITIEYEVLVTEAFVAGNGGVKNEVEIGYVTEDGTSPDPTPSEETVYTGEIEITKVDADDNTIYLKGAVFVIAKTVTEKNENDEDVDVTVYASKITENGVTKIVWTKDVDQATELKTDENGKATFSGLEAGDYELVEITAPEGYNLMANGTPFSLSVVEKEEEDGTVTTTVNMSEKKTIENSAGTLLPSTGGIGTTIFYVVGGILVVAAGVLLITKKRMSKHN